MLVCVPSLFTNAYVERDASDVVVSYTYNFDLLKPQDVERMILPLSVMHIPWMLEVVEYTISGVSEVNLPVVSSKLYTNIKAVFVSPEGVCK